MSVYEWSSPDNHGKQLQTWKKKCMPVLFSSNTSEELMRKEDSREQRVGEEGSQQLNPGWQRDLAHQHQTQKEFWGVLRHPQISEKSTGKRKSREKNLEEKRRLVVIVAVVIFIFPGNLSSMLGASSSSPSPAHTMARSRAASFLRAHKLKMSSAKTLKTFQGNSI